MGKEIKNRAENHAEIKSFYKSVDSPDTLFIFFPLDQWKDTTFVFKKVIIDTPTAKAEGILG